MRIQRRPASFLTVMLSYKTAVNCTGMVKACDWYDVVHAAAWQRVGPAYIKTITCIGAWQMARWQDCRDISAEKRVEMRLSRLTLPCSQRPAWHVDTQLEIACLPRDLRILVRRYAQWVPSRSSTVRVRLSALSIYAFFACDWFRTSTGWVSPRTYKRSGRTIDSQAPGGIEGG